MSAHAVGVLGVGTEPPPESRLPRRSVVILSVVVSTLPRSACVIWPILSASFMRDIRSLTRWLIGRTGFSYGSTPASDREWRAAPAPGTTTATAANAARTAARSGIQRRIPWLLWVNSYLLEGSQLPAGAWRWPCRVRLRVSLRVAGPMPVPAEVEARVVRVRRLPGKT